MIVDVNVVGPFLEITSVETQMTGVYKVAFYGKGEEWGEKLIQLLL